MKVNEVLTEAYTSDKIRAILQKKGYKFLGKGVDQTAYLAPDGMILKIFGTSHMAKKGSMELTKSQKTFKAYADYCLAHQDNKFLPQFSDWTMFEFEGKPYLQIKMERLFPFTKGASGMNYVLSHIADKAERGNSPKQKQDFLKSYENRNWGLQNTDNFNKLMTLVGEDGFNKLWDTITDLKKVARKIGLGNLDLHSGNFMLGSDGEIVISDPFFAGWNAE
jgi:hypothetical protein